MIAVATEREVMLPVGGAHDEQGLVVVGAGRIDHLDEFDARHLDAGALSW